MGKVFLVGRFLFLFLFSSTLNTSFHSFLACKVSAEKSIDSFMEVPLYEMSFVSLTP